MKRVLGMMLLLWVTAGAGAAQPMPRGYGDPWASGVVWDAKLPPNVKRIDGFTLDIQADHTLLVGYHPVRLTAYSTSTFSADRTVEVHFQPLEGNGNAGPIGRIRSTIVCTLEMPLGATSVTKHIYLPHYTYDPVYTVRVLERGALLPGYELTLGASQRTVPLSTVQHRIGVLLPREVGIDPPAKSWHRTPDPSSLLMAVHSPNWLRRSFVVPAGSGPQIDYGEGDALVGSLPQPDIHQARWRAAFPQVGCVLQENELWDNWLGYESLDILLLPLPMLQRLADTEPGKAAAIRHFAAAGGTLWLYAAESEAAIDEVFQTAPDIERRRERHIWREENLLLPTGTRMKTYAAGRLVCIADDYPFPGPVDFWESLLEANQRASITTVRRGVDPAFGDSRFWNWVLPNVAKPPVYPFLTLLGLFTLSVGPVAYRISSKLKRVYLMLLAAPVMAAITTLLMIGYGLLSDGLGYQARIREVTWVDSASGTGVRWTRSTYFAGVRPADGLQFAAQTAVYPYPQQLIERGQLAEEETAAGKIVLGDQQQFVYGFLPSRQQRQFVTFTPQDQLGGLRLVAASDDSPDATRQLRNGFRFGLRDLYLRDLQGEYWHVKQVDALQTAAAVRVTDLEAAQALRVLYADHALGVPAGMQRPRRSSPRTDLDLVGQAVLGLPQPYRSMNEGLVEHQLRSLLQIGGELPEGEFVGLADVTPDVLAREGAKLSDSIHFCMGTWQ